MEEKLDTEVVRKTNKLEINITYVPNYNIGRDAYFGDHVNSMGPITHNVSVVNQTWHELHSKYKTDVILSELQKLAKKLDSAENYLEHLYDVAAIEKAANEIRRGNGQKALSLLSRISKSVIEVSKQIGTNIATEMIMKMAGLK